MSLYNNVPFIFKYFHDEQHTHWREKASQKHQTTAESRQMAKKVFFLLLQTN